MLRVRFSRLGPVPAAILVACAAWPAGRALGADAPAWLRWIAPPECQNTAEVERRVEFLLGRPVDFAAVPSTRVQMAWGADKGWAVEVSVDLGSGPRKRSLDAPSCAEAFDVVALSLALVLEPDLESLAPPPPTESASSDVPSDPVLWEQDSTPSAAAVSAPGGVQRDPNSEQIDRLQPGEAMDRARRATLSVGGAALADLSTFPVPQFGGGAHVALRSGAFRLELEGNLLASESATLAGAEQRVSFSSMFAGLRACHGLVLSSRLVWASCAGAELGSLSTHELGGDERREQGLWFASEALMGPEFSATSWLRAFARARAVTPLIRHEFFLSEGSRVHELPWFGFQLQLGVAADVTDLGGGGH